MMDLVYLYGPPAVGKTTVACELARMLGYVVFDNHLTVSMLEQLFSRETATFWWVNKRLRRWLIDECSMIGKVKGLVSTDVYIAGVTAIEHIEQMVGSVERSGGHAYFVKLSCSRVEQLKRIVDPRRKTGKICTIEDIIVAERGHNYHMAIPGWDSFEIDNTSISPTLAASMIIKKFGLGSNEKADISRT